MGKRKGGRKREGTRKGGTLGIRGKGREGKRDSRRMGRGIIRGKRQRRDEGIVNRKSKKSESLCFKVKSHTS